MLKLLTLRDFFLIFKPDGLYGNRILEIFINRLMCAGNKVAAENVVYSTIRVGNTHCVFNFRLFYYEVFKLLRFSTKFTLTSTRKDLQVPLLLSWLSLTKLTIKGLARSIPVKVSGSFKLILFNLLFEIIKNLLFRGNAYRLVLTHNRLFFSSKKRSHYRW